MPSNLALPCTRVPTSSPITITITICVYILPNSLSYSLQNQTITQLVRLSTTRAHLYSSYCLPPMDSSTAAARSASDEETYATISSAPPKRRAGRTKFRETRHPVYKGVRRRNADRWVCEVREPNKKSRIWLGTFPTAEMAARAHDVAAIALRGRSACLNFADSAWLLPVPDSSSPRDIQRAAAVAAEAFRPPSTESDSTVNETELPSGDGILASRSDAKQMDIEFPFVEDGLNMGMQGYFDMAQGMLIDPPPTTGMMTMPEADDQLESDGEMSLWSYSI